MRAVVGLLALAVAGAIGVGVAVWSGAISLPGSDGCLADEAIDASLREQAVAAADRFFDGVMKGEATQTYASLSANMKMSNSPEQFGAMLSQVAGLGAFTGRVLEHAYQPRLQSGEEASCPAPAGDKSLTVAADPGATQVHLLYRAKQGRDDWAFTIWLIKDAKTAAWEVESFFLFMSSLEGKFARDLLPLAAAQAAKGHKFNAYLLYTAALGLANRGEYFRLGVGAEADAGLKALGMPSELAGEPPFAWKLDGATFNVTNVSIVSADGALQLMLYQNDPAADADAAAAEDANRRLADAFTKAHPEYREVFAGVKAQLAR